MRREITTTADLQQLDTSDNAKTSPPVLPPLVSAAELYSGKIVSPRPLIDDLLWDGLTMLIANPKAGKSWLTLQCAVFIAGGRKVEGMTALEDLLHEEGPLSPAQIAAELSKSRPAVRMLLKRMKDDGLIKKQGLKYIPTHTQSYSVTE